MILRAFLSFLSLTLTAPLPAQAASYTNFGQGCGFGTILFSARATSDPKLGTTCYVYAESPSWFRYFTFSLVILVSGSSNSAWIGGQLPFQVPRLPPFIYGQPACSLLVSPDHLVLPSGGRDAVVPFDIPNDPRLIGFTLYQQWMYWVTEYPPTGAIDYFLVSNGGAMRIGI